MLNKMTPESWLDILRSAEKTVLMQSGRRKAHFILTDGREMVEEYDTNTNVVIYRAWKTKNNFGTFVGWDIEIGNPEPRQNSFQTVEIKESSNSPFITKRLTKQSIEWRIRNLPYKNVYSVTVEKDDTITICTSNKKYYKKLRIPDLERIGLKPAQENVSFMHQFDTLIITYKKPSELIDTESKILNMVLQQKAITTVDFF